MCCKFVAGGYWFLLLNTQIEKTRLEGSLSRRLFTEASILLDQLRDVVLSSGESPTEAIVSLVNRAEQATVGLSGPGVANLRESAQSARELFGMGSFEAEEVQRVSVSRPVERTQSSSVSLSDIQGHWGERHINRLVNLGGISGFPDGTFKPDATISRIEFLAIALRSSGVNVSEYESTFDHWGSNILEAGYDLGVVSQFDIPRSAEALNAPITRNEMANILVRVDENVRNQRQVGTAGVSMIMSDYDSVPSEYKSVVSQAYMKGLIGGVDASGTFAGSATGTRAQAATMVVRLIDVNYREVPELEMIKVIAPEREPMTFREGQKSSILPRAGDTWIKSDGTSVVLTSIFWSGFEVIGAGQGLSIHEIMEFEGPGGKPSGVTVSHGSRGDMWEGSIYYMGQMYVVCPKTGEGHFHQDWGAMAGYLSSEAHEKYGHNAVEGQRYGHWVVYDGTAWRWDGPTELDAHKPLN